MTLKPHYDVVIVGAGGSGLAAGVRAAELGCSVLILEKQSQPGGTTGIAVGSFTANGTTQQQGAGITDTSLAHDEDAAQFAPASIEANNNPELRRYFLTETANTLAWLSGLGLRFSGPHPEPPNRVHRMHNVVPGARAYIHTLRSRLKALNGTLVTEAFVQDLVTDNDRVVGVTFKHEEKILSVRAHKGVVLAAGDYANAADLIANHKGPQFASIGGINPHANGDGHRLVASVGGVLRNMGITYGPEIRFIAPDASFRILDWLRQQRFPTPLANVIAKYSPRSLMQYFAKSLIMTWQHPEDALFEDGGILVNQEGRRFCNELETPHREIAISQQPKKQAYILLDESLIERYSQWPHFISTAPKIAYAYVSDFLTRRQDIAIRAKTVLELAEKKELPSQNLITTIQEYNQAVASKKADPFGRDAIRRELAGSSWVLLGPAKAYFTTTEGGAAVNQNLQVLRPDGTPFEKLYAVGQNGLGGQILWGHGLHIAWAMTSGKLVGEQLGSPRSSAPPEPSV